MKPILFCRIFFCKNSLFAEKSGAYGWLQQDGWVDENPVYENVRKMVFFLLLGIILLKEGYRNPTGFRRGG